MKVAYILHSTIMGGSTISFFNMVGELKSRGIEIAVIVPGTCIDSTFLTHIKELNIPLFEGNIIESYFFKPKTFRSCVRLPFHILKKLIKKFLSLVFLIRVLKSLKPDIVHTNSGVVHEGFYASKILKIPHVWHLREYQDLDFGMSIIPSFSCFSKILKKSFVISITDDIKKHFNLDETALTIYNGIFSKDEVSYSKEKDSYFLCASRISKEKGHTDVIRQFSAFCKVDDSYRLVVAGFGDDDYIQELKNLAQGEGCLSRIDFVGFQNRDQIKSLMQRAKALIVASYNEGFGRMTAEACFCGCVVIGRDTAGTKEILDKTGGVKFKTENELYQSMVKVSQLSDDEYERIALQAQQISVEAYTVERNADKILEVYASVVNNK